LVKFVNNCFFFKFVGKFIDNGHDYFMIKSIGNWIYLKYIDTFFSNYFFKFVGKIITN